MPSGARPGGPLGGSGLLINPCPRFDDPFNLNAKDPFHTEKKFYSSDLTSVGSSTFPRSFHRVASEEPEFNSNFLNLISSTAQSHHKYKSTDEIKAEEEEKSRVTKILTGIWED